MALQQCSNKHNKLSESSQKSVQLYVQTSNDNYYRLKLIDQYHFDTIPLDVH